MGDHEKKENKKKRDTFDKVKIWFDCLEEKSHEDRSEIYTDLFYRGRFNRKFLASECIVAKSVFNQNDLIRPYIEGKEKEFRDKGILPLLATEESRGKSHDNPKIYNQFQGNDIYNKKRISDLEVRVIELEAQNKRLKEENLRFEELSELLGEYGCLP